MDDLIKALRSGEQADLDGTLVKVSRQACEEAADAIEALQAQLAEARALLKRTLPALDAAHDTHIMALGRNPDDYDSKFRRIAADIRAMKGERG